MTGPGGVPPSVPGPRSPGPSDPGLPAERTALSWRRTAMSVAVGSAVGLKLLPPYLGVAGYVAGAFGLLWSIDLALCARRRYHDADRALRIDLGTGGEHVRLGAASRSRSVHVGYPVARTALVTGLVGLGSLVAVLVMAA